MSSATSSVSPPPERAPAGGRPGWPWWTAPAALVVALGVTLFASVVVVAVVAAAGGHPDGSDKGAVNLVLTLVQDASFVGVAIAFAMQTGRPRPGDFGLRATPLRAALGWAAAAALAYIVFAAIWNAAVAGPQKQDDIFNEIGIGRGALEVAVLGVLVCVIAPFAEEFLFRGFCFTALRPKLGVLGAALVVGGVFGAIHVGSTPPALLVDLAVLGFVLCLVRWRTRSLLPCIGLHAVNNAVAFGQLEGWGWQILPLAAGALAVLGLGLRPLIGPRG